MTPTLFDKIVGWLTRPLKAASALYWAFLVALFGGFLVLRIGESSSTSIATVEAASFAVLVALLLSPLFAEMELLGVKLARAVEEATNEVKKEVTAIRQDLLMVTSARAHAVNYVVVNEREVSPAIVALAERLPPSLPRRSALQYQILNTLWTKQVNKWPDRSTLFGMLIDFGNEAQNCEFAVAADALVGEGLVARAPDGHLVLTDGGFAYSKSHFREFPPEQWWPHDPLLPEQLAQVLGSTQ